MAAPRRKRLPLPRPPALYHTARLAIKPRAASSLEVVLRYLIQPKRARSPWWHPTDHLIAAATEAEDLQLYAQDQAATLAEQEGAEALAAIAREAERELGEIGHRLRMRLPTRARLAAPGSVLRSVSLVRMPRDLELAPLGRMAASVALDYRRRPRPRPKPDRQPLVALRKDVEVLAAHLAPGFTWPEEWGDLRAITSIALSANDLAERIEKAVQQPDPRGRWRTRRYVPAPRGDESEDESDQEEAE